MFFIFASQLSVFFALIVETRSFHGEWSPRMLAQIQRKFFLPIVGLTTVFLFFLSFSNSLFAATQVQMQMLQFGTASCPTCVQIQPKINEFIAQKWPIQFIDAAQEQNLAQQFRIQSIPTFVLLVDSQEVGRFTASPDPQNVHQQIVALFAKGREIIKARENQQNPQFTQGPPQHPQQDFQQNQNFSQPSPPHQQNESVSVELTDIAPSNSNGRQLIGQSMERQQPNAPYLQQNQNGSTPAEHAAQNPTMQGQGQATPKRSGAELIPLFLSASVRLRINDPTGLSTGTGTIIDTGDGEALILTCGHIFEKSQGQGSVEIELFLDPAPNSDGNPGSLAPRRSVKVQGKCSHYDRQTREDDIAFVKFKLPPTVEMRAVPMAPQDNLRVGQALVSVGCDGGSPPTIRQHRIMSLDKSFTAEQNLNQFNYIQVSGAPTQGRSGGGLFCAEGYLVGVCNTGDPGSNDGLFVPLPVIRKQLDRLGLSFVYKEPSLYSPATSPQDSSIALATTGEPFTLNASAASMEPAEPLANTSVDTLTSEEKATVEEIRRRQAEGAEIILIVNRPGKGNEKAKSEIIKLENVSDQFLDALTQKSRSSLTEQAASLNHRVENRKVAGTLAKTKQHEVGLRTQHGSP